MRIVSPPALLCVVFVMCVPAPALSDGQEWRNDEDFMYALVSPASDGREAVNGTVDKILIYSRPWRERGVFNVERLLAEEADFQTVSRREILAILGGVQDYSDLEPTDYCYRNNGVWKFHTLIFDYDLKRVAYIRIQECTHKLGTPGMTKSRDAGSVVHPSRKNTTANSSRSIIRVLRELGIPGA